MLSQSSLRFLPPLVFLAFAAGCQDADRSVAPPRNHARFSVTDGPGTWTTKASMPTARWSLATGGVNGILYAVGGTSGPNPLATVEAFDPATNTWTTKASMPVGKTQSAAGVVNGILYLVGYNGTLAYDPGTDTWTTKASIPTAQLNPAAAVVNGVVYVVGGFSGPNWVATVQAYDPATDTWTSKASMPTARSGLAAGVVNGILYAVGGGNASGSLATVEAYDPATNTWTTKASMPTARSGLAAGVVNGILYAVGGSTGSDRPGTVEAYDPATNTWTSKASMPTARNSLAAGVVNGILYFVGGADVTYSALATVEAYQPATANPWPNEPAGFTTLTDWPYNQLVTNADGSFAPDPNVWNQSPGTGDTAIVSDPGAPLSPSSVARITYPIGMPSGTEPWGLYFNPTPAGREFYTAYWWKASAGWEGEPSGINKISFWVDDTQNGPTGNLIVMMNNQNQPAYFLTVTLEFNVASNGQLVNAMGGEAVWHVFGNVNGGNYEIVPGNWYRIELYFKGSTTPTSQDGILRWWATKLGDPAPTQVGDYTNVNFDTPNFAAFAFSPTWGGNTAGLHKAQTDFYWFDHVYLSAP